MYSWAARESSPAAGAGTPAGECTSGARVIQHGSSSPPRPAGTRSATRSPPGLSRWRPGQAGRPGARPERPRTGTGMLAADPAGRHAAFLPPWPRDLHERPRPSQGPAGPGDGPPHGRDGRGLGVYAHVTPESRAALIAADEADWKSSLAARAAISPGSPVAVLDALLPAVPGRQPRAFPPGPRGSRNGWGSSGSSGPPRDGAD